MFDVEGRGGIEYAKAEAEGDAREEAEQARKR